MKPACVTDYVKLYATDYFAHSSGSSSFNTSAVPAILARICADYGHALLDIGGGNGLLCDLLAPMNIKGFTLDASNRSGERHQTLDLSTYSIQLLNSLRSRLHAALGESWFATCFDVAEHIDKEHIADFLLNLAYLVPSQCAISISTRPSSQGNRFHSSILPIDTWFELFTLAGFDVFYDEELDHFCNSNLFSGSDEAIVAVAHWQRARPFRDRLAHQHYLRISKKRDYKVPSNFSQIVSGILDIDYRKEKRAQFASPAAGELVYNVHFIQDWSFARSIMDVWPTDKMKILIRQDCIATPYRHLLVNYCRRVGVQHEVISDVSHGAATMDAWGIGPETLLMTATEGVKSPLHLMNSLLDLEGMRRGALTLSLLHGSSVSRSYRPATDVVGAWDTETQEALAASLRTVSSAQVLCLGSVKWQDAVISGARPTKLHLRFGQWVNRFRKRILVGVNLVFGGDDFQGVSSWLRRLLSRNPDVLFLVRPHPDNGNFYIEHDLFQFENITLLDELTLLSMDVSIMRILGEVDGVITSASTLMVDAMAAGVAACGLFGRTDISPLQEGLLPTSWPTLSGVGPQEMSEEDWQSGKLPEALGSVAPIKSDFFGPSREAVRRLGNLANEAQRRNIGDFESSLYKSFTEAACDINFSEHYHRNMKLTEAAIETFLARPL